MLSVYVAIGHVIHCALNIKQTVISLFLDFNFFGMARLMNVFQHHSDKVNR